MKLRLEQHQLDAEAARVAQAERSALVKNTFLVLLANGVGLAVSFFLRPLIARFTGPSEYGVFALIFSTGAVLSAFVLLSLNSGVLFFTAKNHKDDKYVGKVVASGVWTIAIIAAVLFVPLYFLFTTLAPTLDLASFFAAYAIAFGIALFSILQAGQQGLEHFKAFSAVNVSSTVVAGILAVAAAFMIHSGLYTALARAAGVFVVTIIGFAALKHFGAFDWKILKQMGRYSLPLALATLLSAFINVVDRYVIAAFYNTAEVGFYDISYSFATAILPISTALLITIAPRIIKNVSKLDAYYKRASIINAVLLTGFALGLFYYSDIIIFFLLGKAYVAGAVMPLKILALALPLMAIFGLNGSVFSSIDKMRVYAVLSTLLVFASLFFNFLLVPSMGGVGAAWANLCAYFLIAALGLAYLFKEYRVSLARTFAQIALFVAFAGAYFLFAEQFGFIGKTAFYALFVALTLILQREAATEIINELQKIFLKRFTRKT